MKKQALVGSPISSIVIICLAKNLGGASVLMGVAASKGDIRSIRSGR